MKACVITIVGERAMLQLGKVLLQDMPLGTVIFLQGQLGVGKTTLVRSAIQGQGYSGRVKSPTYTLVETYPLSGLSVSHFDLYRLGDPEELEYMGYREYFNNASVCFIEWPEKGAGMLPKPDLMVDIQHQGQARLVSLMAHSEVIENWLAEKSGTCAIIKDNQQKK